MTVSEVSADETRQRPRGRAKQRLAAIVAVASLVGFGALALYLLIDIDVEELTWSRRVYIFAGVEAITFAGVGWLFGREVHRERAEVAEDRAANAEQKVEAVSATASQSVIDASRFRDRGLLLREELRSAVKSHQTRGPSQTSSPIADLAAKAELLFPDD